MLEFLARLFRKSRISLPAEWIEHTRDMSEFTPDMWLLEQHWNQRLFVCDEMMKNHAHHDLIKGHGFPLCKAAFTADAFQLWTAKEGITVPTDFPILKKAPFLPIKGELYAIRPTRFLELDRFKLNGIHFVRKRVKIVIPHREVVFVKERDLKAQQEANGQWNNPSSKHTMPVRIATVRAWMYVAASDYWLWRTLTAQYTLDMGSNRSKVYVARIGNGDVSLTLVRSFKPKVNTLGPFHLDEYYYLPTDEQLATK